MPHALGAEGSAAVFRLDIAFVYENRQGLAHRMAADLIAGRQFIFRGQLLPRLDFSAQYGLL